MALIRISGANMSIHIFQSLHMWLGMPGLMHYRFNSTCMHNTCRCKFCCLAVHVPCVRDLKILHHRLLSLNFINTIYEGHGLHKQEDLYCTYTNFNFCIFANFSCKLSWMRTRKVYQMRDLRTPLQHCNRNYL